MFTHTGTFALGLNFPSSAITMYSDVLVPEVLTSVKFVVVTMYSVVVVVKFAIFYSVEDMDDICFSWASPGCYGDGGWY